MFVSDRSKERLAEVMRFCLVGGLAAAIHYGVYLVLQLWMEALTVAYSIGYGVALVVNFFLTSYFTFRSAPDTRKAAGFGASHALNYLLHIFLFKGFIWIGVSRYWAPLLVLAIAVPTNFLLLRWVFKHKKREE